MIALHLDNPGMPARARARIQHAIQVQVNQQVAPVWHRPKIRWAKDGIQVIVESQREVWSSCGSTLALACHSVTQSGVPVIWASRGPGLSVSISHEVIETLIEPWLSGYEVCDPVNASSYYVAGVQVADFMMPNLTRSWVDNLDPSL